jgi:hypothetical protein
MAKIEIAEGELRAANWRNKDSIVLHSQFGDCFCHQLVNDAMAAARAVVCLVFRRPPYALIPIEKDR